VKDVQQIARYRLSLLRDLLLVHCSLERSNEFIAILLDDTAHQLLKDESDLSELQE
jgi:hypothetical protein